MSNPSSKNTIINRLELASNEMELIDFRIYEIRDGALYTGIYGINVSKVNEIINKPEILAVPSCPHYVLGVFDLRGTIIPIIDLSIWMGIKNKAKIEHQSVIITSFNNLQIGFLVDEAKRIRRVSWSDIQGADYNSSTTQDYKITAITKIEGNQTLLILDLESIVDHLGFYLDDASKDKKVLDDEVESFSGLVLVVDDSLSARKMITRALQKMGFSVVEAKDGEDGLLKLDELYQKYQNSLSENLKLIVTDVEMPKLDGFHFAQKLRSDGRFSDLPIIFNSSICDKYSEEKALKMGAKSYLVKFDATSFYNTIKEILL